MPARVKVIAKWNAVAGRCVVVDEVMDGVFGVYRHLIKY